jgi:CRP/FNR family transcriptional regulator, cyclic AMP receptor protein
MDLIETLRQVELFHGMTSGQLAKVAEIAEINTYQAGDFVFTQGQTGDSLYVIQQGQVEVRVQKNGEPSTTVYLGAGQTVGEMALIDQATRSASIVAVDADTRLYRIGTADFTRLCAEETGIGYIFMRNIAQDLSFKLRHRDYDPGHDEDDTV